MMQKEHTPVAEKLFNMARQLVSTGLNKGTSGNVSVREGDGFLITPSGMVVEEMCANSMVHVQFDGQHETNKKPSSEWRFHRDIFQARTEVNAVIHTHSMFATTVACLRKDIPPFHYMIAVAGGSTIRCAPYALFGSQTLSDYALVALQGRKACLLANHGMIVLGRDLKEAFALTVEVENLCEQYWRLLQTGEEHLLTEAQMRSLRGMATGNGVKVS